MRYVYCSECLLRVESKSASHFLLTQYTKGICTQETVAHVQKMYACCNDHKEALISFYEGRKGCTFQPIKSR